MTYTPTPDNPGSILQSTLTGAELVDINIGPVWACTTTGDIAALAADSTNQIVSTSINTVGNGTLTAAALVGGLVSRGGTQSGAFTDTTDTAANIVAALPSGFESGAQFRVFIKNATSYVETISAGSGVTFSAVNIIGPWEEAYYYATVGGTAASPTVTFSHIQTNAIALSQAVVSPQSVALNTVGAGSLTGTAIAGGFITRGGAQSGAFTDTTDTGANIIAASVALIGKTGASFYFEYSNTTSYVATIAANATGVTLAGVTTVPPNTIGQFQVQSTSGTAVTITGTGITQNISTGVTIAGSTSGYVEFVTPATAGAVTLTTPPETGSSDTLVGTGAVQTLTNKTITDAIQNGNSQITTGFTTSSSTTLANVIGLAVAVSNSGVYNFRAHLNGTAGSSGGIKVSYSGPTLSGLNATCFNWNGTTLNAVTNISNTTSAFTSNAAAYTDLYVDGCFTVGASGAGTFQLQAAQNTSSTTATTVVINSSYLEVWRVS